MILGSLFLVAFVSAGGTGPGDEEPGGVADVSATEADGDPFAAPGLQPASLAELREVPGRHLGRSLRFIVQLSGPVESWNPYLTRFGPGDYVRFQAWSDESFVWEMGVFADPAPYLFVRRGSLAEALLANGRRFERFEVTGGVREVFLGEPWIEVEHVRLLPKFVGEGTILHVNWALTLSGRGMWTAAIEQLERARSENLPRHAGAELDRLVEGLRRERETAKRR
ncbi:MAG: hypothetical protein O7B99_15880 [Planctomycetota bacterium]|nr:hypothetical protein [Planctomycetota bacterium]